MRQLSVPSSIAPLRNVAALASLVERVVNRGSNLPGMGALYGKTGRGKSFSATYACNKHKAYYVQVKSVWTRKKLCQAVLLQMGISPAGTISDMMDQIGEQLALSRRPLIIDEADYLIAKGMIEVVRDIYESSMGAVILIGEENLPNTLKRFERMHNRVLDWVVAQPCDMQDCRELARIYCAGINVAEDLIAKIHASVDGCTRRVCVNMDHVREFARGHGLESISAATYHGRIDTGMPERG